jgi:hypothetical protein
MVSDSGAFVQFLGAIKRRCAIKKATINGDQEFIK